MTAPRLTGGTARGRPVGSRVPEGVRPTSARVREALFSILGQDLTGIRVLDAFGGTGLLGLEAWSRGAEVAIVEKVAEHARAIAEAARALGARGVTVKAGDVLRVAPGLGRFDGVLVDPPYALDPGPILEVLAPLADGWLVLEADARTIVPAEVGGLRADAPRRYGDTTLRVYRRAEAPAAE